MAINLKSKELHEKKIVAVVGKRHIDGIGTPFSIFTVVLKTSLEIHGEFVCTPRNS